MDERKPATPAANNKFWIIWNPDHHAPPTARFATYEAAEASARVMATRFWPHRFYVCEASGVVEAQAKVRALSKRSKR